MKRYQYLVTYSFHGGIGRTFVTCDEPIDSDGRVESVERSITGNNGIDTVAMTGFYFLRFLGDENEDQRSALGREVAALGLTLDHIKAMQRACAGMTSDELQSAVIDYKTAPALCAGNQLMEKHK